MRFVKTLTVLAESTEAAPSSTTIRLIKGTLTRIEVAFPPGPANYVHVVIMDRILQIAPANPEESLAWDDFTHSFSMNYPMGEPPYELILNGWSLDAKYNHDIRFRLDIDTTEKDDREVLLELVTGSFKPYGERV